MENSLLKNIPEDLGEVQFCDISIFIHKDNEKETIYHIPNTIYIDYWANRKQLLKQYKNVEIRRTNGEVFHEILCTKKWKK